MQNFDVVVYIHHVCGGIMWVCIQLAKALKMVARADIVADCCPLFSKEIKLIFS